MFKNQANKIYQNLIKNRKLYHKLLNLVVLFQKMIIPVSKDKKYKLFI